MNIDPPKEVIYIVKLAKKYLEEAEKSLQRRDYRDAVLNSQLSIENSAKAAISIFHIPSWSHNPGPELRSLLKSFPKDLRKDVERLAQLSEELAPEHGRATYGEPTRGLTPWEIYSYEDAYRAISIAREGFTHLKKIVSKFYPDII